MKKLLCFLLSAIMIFSLFACDEIKKSEKDDEDDVRGNISSDKDDEGAELSLGKTSGGTYTNDFLGLSWTLPEGWEFYSDAEILALNNIAEGYLDEDVAKQLEKASLIYDMYAQNSSEGSTVNVVIEKLRTTKIDIKTSLESQIDMIKSSYANMGYTDVSVEYEKVTVDGQEFDGLRMTAKIQGFDFYAQIFAFKKDNYMANVTLCTLYTDTTGDLLDLFTVK